MEPYEHDQMDNSPPWINLPMDITANILHRLGAIEILQTAWKVCTAWRTVCFDRSMWRVIDMRNTGLYTIWTNLEFMCRHAVDRSHGELIDINIEYFGTDDLLDYIAQRSSRLRRLSLASCYKISSLDALIKAIEKFPKSEELHLILIKSIRVEDIKAISTSCPMLKSFSFNKIYCSYYEYREGQEANKVAFAIVKYMPNLCHLGLIGNEMENEGLQAILDGCPRLELLDLRECLNLALQGDLGKRCSRQVKRLSLSSDSTHDNGWFAYNLFSPHKDCIKLRRLFGGEDMYEHLYDDDD